MNHPLRNLLMAVMLCSSLPSLGLAQETSRGAEPTGRVVEILQRRAMPLNRIAVRGDRPRQFWTSNLDRIPEWALPPGAEPIQVIDFRFTLVGEDVEVVVSAFRGKRFREIVEVIGTYTLKEGESKTITELERYGFQPIPMKLVRVAPMIANVPVVINMTRSVEVATTPIITDTPAVKIDINNRSNKSILAFIWHTTVSGRMLGSQSAAEMNGEPFIAANGSRSMSIPVETLDRTAPVVNLHIDAVVFSDGTYEGDQNKAADFRAFVIGRFEALSRIVPLLEKAALESQTPQSLSGLIRSIEADPRRRFKSSLKDDLIREMGPIRDMEPVVNRSAERVEVDVIRALKDLMNSLNGPNDVDAQKMLSRLAKLHRAWLERLPK